MEFRLNLSLEKVLIFIFLFKINNFLPVLKLFADTLHDNTIYLFTKREGVYKNERTNSKNWHDKTD